MNVSLKEAPGIDLGEDIEKCDHESIDFDIEYPNATYLWSDGNVVAQNSIIESGTYWAKVFLNGCVCQTP